jgi:tubulin polyglutamylase TTLL5
LKAERGEKTKVVKEEKKSRVPATVQVDDCLEYSHLYRNFYDIFAGYHNGVKDFDLQYCVRESRNVYASFVNLLDTNALLMQQKHKFEAHPLEIGIRDLFPNHFGLIGKNLE